ncbi:hypothetical protein DYH09_35170, partial [bacterium CPR1]|nr:hypothetical protein [bacterium CPR1]
GRAAGASLVELYLKATNAGWPALRQELELSPDLAEETFWAGLWKSLGGATSRAGEEDTLSEFERLIRGVEAECLRSLTGRNPVIPTDLWGSFSGTTAQHSIRAQVTGLLARETIFRGAERLLARYYAPLSLVDFRVAQLLARVLPGFSVPTLNLSRLVTQALPDDQLTPETADLVAEACSEQSLNEFEGELHGEIQELRQKLGSLLAKNADAQWRRLDGLLIDSAQDTEEQLLCRFSPSERLLSPDYSEQARPFLLQVRGAPSSSTEEIADWVLSASGGSARHGALIYILQGARGRDVAARLYRLLATGRPSWLRAVLETGVLVALGFSAGDARELIRLILPPTAGPRPLETKPIGNPIARLRRLQEWWTRNGEECLRRYERRVYPHQCLPDLESKKGWLVLLMLGALHRMGRQKRQQSRGFLEMFESRNWLDKMLFARAKPEGLIDVLDQYFAEEDDQRFFHWLGFLPTMYQLSRWLDEYVVMLEAAESGSGRTSWTPTALLPPNASWSASSS